MQPSEFEKNIQNKMEGFELAPTGEVWKQVSARIGKEQKRRRVGYFWTVAALLLIAGGAGWWFFSKGDSIKNNQQTTIANKSSSAEKEMIAVENDTIDKKDVAEVVERPAVQQTAPSATNFRIRSRERLIVSEVAGVLPASKNISTIEKINDNAERFERSREVPDHSFYNPGLSKKSIASADTINPNEVQKTQKESASSPVKSAKKSANKKWMLGLGVYGGVSDNLTQLPVFSGSLNADAFASSAPVTGTIPGGFNTSIPALTFESSLSYGFGMFATTPISSRFTFSAGVDYHFYSTKSMVGMKVNASAIGSPLSNQLRSSAYYLYGQSETFINKYHYLELPLNLGFRINQNKDRAFLISTGITPGYIINSGALYANHGEQRYYEDKAQFKRLQFSGQFGLSIPFIGTKKFQVSAGPTVQFGITNLIKKELEKDQHHVFTGLKAAITFK